MICDFYEKLFTSSPFDGSNTIAEALNPCIYDETNESLIKDPTAAEIKEATFLIHPDKAPGPDGFSASFFQSNWEVVRPAIVQEIQLFFTTGSLPISANNTQVRLIPKSTEAKKVTDYRPIALCNVFYKIISKLLSMRLKPVLCKIISENQSAFVPGRAISDNVLITHEVLQFLKTSKAEIHCTMAVKTDMSKAYDRIEWEFMAEVLRRLGFHEKWNNWIMQCIATVRYSYLINDSIHGTVIPQRGIRQGDPLSPYLFILCGKVLSGLCTKAAREGTLKGVKVARGSPRVNHLLFTDDTMFFCEATSPNCSKLKAILLEYEKASGQRINTGKSSITFSSKTPPQIKETAKVILEIPKEGGTGRYLGLPESFGRRKKDLFTSIVDRVRQKAVSWASRRLSKAGKLTMLKTVLTAIPSYTMTSFEIPVSLCRRIQSVLTRFWWDGSEEQKKLCWVVWDKLTKHKAEGGLGLRDIQLFNQALLAKQAWRILNNPGCLMARVLLGKYCHSKAFLDVKQPPVCSHGWRGILHGRDLLRKHLGKAIGNGETTSVWKDSWISLDEDIKPYGPVPESFIDLKVSDLLTSDLKWNEKRLAEILPQMASRIKCIHPSERGAADIYIWQPVKSGQYTTRSGYNSAVRNDTGGAAIPNNGFDWIKDVWTGKFSPKMSLRLVDHPGSNTTRPQSTKERNHVKHLLPLLQR